jgi:hypothetical protein
MRKSITTKLTVTVLIPLLISVPPPFSEGDELFNISMGINYTRYAYAKNILSAGEEYYYFIVNVSMKNNGDEIFNLKYENFTLFYTIGRETHETCPHIPCNNLTDPDGFRPLNSDSLTPGKTITGEVAFSIIEKGVIGVPVRLEYRHGNRRMSIGFPKYMI